MRVTAAQLEAKRKGKPLPRPEREILRAILDYLATRRDVVAWRNNVGAVKEGERFIRFGMKGLPDIIGWKRLDIVVPGHPLDLTLHPAAFLAIEVKAHGAPIRPEQAAFLEQARAAGCIAFVARSIEDVIRGLDGR